MAFQASKSKDDYQEDVYDAVVEDKRCSHFFKRVSATRVECTKCHIGFLDSGDFPIEAINEFYSGAKTQEYFKSL
jgi:hypothetical protein